jgi:mono/diheme cytochrome c family protein
MKRQVQCVLAGTGVGRRAPGKRLAVTRALILTLGALSLAGARAAESPTPSPGRASLMGVRFTQTDGADLYQVICQGCHMPDGAGARGAASYPALTRDARLAVKGFPVTRVLNGSKAMPPFKDILSDEQIAAVVSYVRTHFGNAYKDKVSGADVKALR